MSGPTDPALKSGDTMKMTIQATDESVQLTEGGEGQVWRGLTEAGVRVVVVVSRIGCHAADEAVFQRELSAHGESAVAAPKQTLN